MIHAHHALELEGVWSGIPMWELHCRHDDDCPIHHMDDKGNHHDECLIQTWFGEDGLDICDTSTDLTDQGHVLYWTTWNYAQEPLLMGRSNYHYWKDGYDQDQADD